MANEFRSHIINGNHSSMASFGAVPQPVYRLTKLFVRQHAEILCDFSGKYDKFDEYCAILEKFRDDPLKFDKEFAALRTKVFETLH